MLGRNFTFQEQLWLLNFKNGGTSTSAGAKVERCFHFHLQTNPILKMELRFYPKLDPNKHVYKSKTSKLEISQEIFGVSQ